MSYLKTVKLLFLLNNIINNYKDVFKVNKTMANDIINTYLKIKRSSRRVLLIVN